MDILCFSRDVWYSITNHLDMTERSYLRATCRQLREKISDSPQTKVSRWCYNRVVCEHCTSPYIIWHLGDPYCKTCGKFIRKKRKICHIWGTFDLYFNSDRNKTYSEGYWYDDRRSLFDSSLFLEDFTGLSESKADLDIIACYTRSFKSNLHFTDIENMIHYCAAESAQTKEDVSRQHEIIDWLYDELDNIKPKRWKKPSKRRKKNADEDDEEWKN